MYLHGHLHEIDSLFGPKGLVSLGFGATYLGPLSGISKPYYRNTFAICELNDHLEVQFVSWDSEYGSWVKETRLPADVQASRLGPEGPYTLPIPSTSALSFQKRSMKEELLAAASAKLRISAPVWLDADPTQGWQLLLEQLGVLTSVSSFRGIGNRDAKDSAAQFIATDANGKHVVSASSAPSAVVTYSQIEQINTLLDTESLDSCTLVTFGTLSEDATTLVARLERKKALRVLTGARIAAEAHKISVVRRLRDGERFKFEEVEITPLIVQNGIALLVADAVGSAWFCLVGPDGELLEASSDLAFRVRKAVPQLKDAHYSSTSKQPPGVPPDSAFDRVSYLTRSAELFDTVRYSGLAALGFRLPIDSLRKLYIPAAADVSNNQANDRALKTAVDDFIDALNLDIAQRDQLEVQLRNYYGLGRNAEAGAASTLYKRYGAILVVGDPGSGKSCFVKSEMLAYSLPPRGDELWYGKHTPIFLPLADAAKLTGRGEELLDICVRFAETQRLNLSRSQLDILLSKGEAAFFFDGVDEVGSLEVRQKILGQIGHLVENHRDLGNRFVVTSRPAAIQGAELTQKLVRLDLRGLTNHEVALLATRIMSIDAASGRMAEQLTGAQKETVEQLIQDCEEKPGIGRLARNPLLLTLLVLIYANSGPLSARRHIIYSQAVKTLASVRNREIRIRALSEADLRRQLGRLAIAIYRGAVSEIPTRLEVRETLAPGSPTPKSSEAIDVDRFISEVAENTGLIVIHPRSDNTDDDVISFMHHSFLEYYAAVGFMRDSEYQVLASQVALTPRWRDVVTLMFGLLGEQGDISAFLMQIATDREASEKITCSRLALALDCALECDVPPEEAQVLIADLLSRTLSSGAGKLVGEVREYLAPRVQELLQNTASEIILNRLVAGVQSADAQVSASHVDFLARMPEVVGVEPKLKNAITCAFDTKRSMVRMACISALTEIQSLRSEENLARLRVSIERGTIPEQHAALQLLDKEPALIPSFRDGVIESLNSRSKAIATLASRCVIIGGVFVKESFEDRPLLSKALRIYTQLERPQAAVERYLEVPTDKLESLIFSESTEDQKLGIRMVMAIRREPAVLHGYLFSVLRQADDHELRASCLEAMAFDARIIKIATLADTELVSSCAIDKHSDVRRAAVRALRHFAGLDFVRETLRDRYEKLRDSNEQRELGEVIRAIAAHGISEKEPREFLQEELMRVLARSNERWGERRRDLVIKLLQACEQMGGSLTVKGSSLVYEIGSDFRTPKDVRRIAIRAFGRTALATVENGSRLLGLIERNERLERLAAFKAIASYVDRARGNVVTVRQVRPILARLKASLISKWESESGLTREGVDVVSLRDIRHALVSLEETLASFGEFSSRVQVDETDRQQRRLNFGTAD